MALDPIQFISVMGNWLLVPVFLIFGFATIAQALIVFGVRVPYYSDHLERREAERFSRFLDAVSDADVRKAQALTAAVFQRQREFLISNAKLITDHQLNRLGLVEAQLTDLRAATAGLALRPSGTSEQRIDTLRRWASDPHVCIDAEQLPRAIYRDVRYFLNFADAMFDEAAGPALGQLLAEHIKSALDPQLVARAVLIAPARGNMLLALEAARILRRPTVLMREHPRIRENQFWDGTLSADAYPVIVHDVAVSGAQLINARERLQAHGVNVQDVACLIDRTDEAAKSLLQRAGLRLLPVTTISDDEIAALRT